MCLMVMELVLVPLAFSLCHKNLCHVPLTHFLVGGVKFQFLHHHEKGARAYETIWTNSKVKWNPRVLGLGGSKTFQISATANEAICLLNLAREFITIFLVARNFCVVCYLPRYTQQADESCIHFFLSLARENIIDILVFLASMYETCIYFILIP